MFLTQFNYRGHIPVFSNPGPTLDEWGKFRQERYPA